jgi:hypothetical protein
LTLAAALMRSGMRRIPACGVHLIGSALALPRTCKPAPLLGLCSGRVGAGDGDAHAGEVEPQAAAVDEAVAEQTADAKAELTFQPERLTEEVKERFYAISAERRIKHPAESAITEAARRRLFG